MPAASPDRYRGRCTTVRYAEGLEVGYRWYNRHAVRPLFPFGFGLSYARIALAPPRATATGDGWTVTATLRNLSARAGVAVPQLYVSFPAAADEPPRQLKGFDRVELKPGETRMVSFALPRSRLAKWDAAAAAWHVVPGRYRIEVGTSSADLAGATAVDVPATSP